MAHWKTRPVFAEVGGDGGSGGDPPPPPPPPPEDDLSKWDAERAKSTIVAQRAAEKELKAQLADARKILAALEEDKTKRELAEMTEIDRLKKETADAKEALVRKDAEIADIQTRARVSAAASKMNVVDPEVAYLLLNKTELDTEEKVEASLKELLKSKPYLAAVPKGDDGKGKSSPPTPKPDAKGATAEQIREGQLQTAASYRSNF